MKETSFTPRDRAFEEEALAFAEFTDPATLDFVGQRVQPLGDVVGSGIGGGEISGDPRIEHASDCSLLDDFAIIARSADC